MLALFGVITCGPTLGVLLARLGTRKTRTTYRNGRPRSFREITVETVGTNVLHP